jgi:hypothetical protein
MTLRAKEVASSAAQGALDVTTKSLDDPDVAKILNNRVQDWTDTALKEVDRRDYPEQARKKAQEFMKSNPIIGSLVPSGLKNLFSSDNETRRR